MSDRTLLFVLYSVTLSVGYISTYVWDTGYTDFEVYVVATLFYIVIMQFQILDELDR